VVDKFQVSVPLGTSVLVFDFYPWQTISPFRQRLAAHLTAFLDAYWAEADRYPDVRIGLVRDVFSPSVQWFQPLLDGSPRAGWPAASLQFLLAGIQQIETSSSGLGSGEQVAVTPVDTLGLAAGGLAPTLDASQASWVHLIYLRDWDLVLTPGEQANEGDIRARLSSALSVPGLSPFRYGIGYFDFLSPQSSCHPLPTHQGVNLRAFLATYHSKEFELCDFSDDDLRRAAAFVHTDAASLTLSRVPDFGTLAVNVAGQDVPRSQVRVDPATNVISLVGSAAGLLQPGALMEVSYVPLSN
jgi:hypothetical protein